MNPKLILLFLLLTFQNCSTKEKNWTDNLVGIWNVDIQESAATLIPYDLSDTLKLDSFRASSMTFEFKKDGTYQYLETYKEKETWNFKGHYELSRSWTAYPPNGKLPVNSLETLPNEPPNQINLYPFKNFPDTLFAALAQLEDGSLQFYAPIWQLSIVLKKR